MNKMWIAMLLAPCTIFCQNKPGKATYTEFFTFDEEGYQFEEPYRKEIRSAKKVSTISTQQCEKDAGFCAYCGSLLVGEKEGNEELAVAAPKADQRKKTPIKKRLNPSVGAKSSAPHVSKERVRVTHRKKEMKMREESVARPAESYIELYEEAENTSLKRPQIQQRRGPVSKKEAPAKHSLESHAQQEEEKNDSNLSNRPKITQRKPLSALSKEEQTSERQGRFSTKKKDALQKKEQNVQRHEKKQRRPVPERPSKISKSQFRELMFSPAASEK